MNKNNKGFTLAELLIFVAIIAVLVAIAIPVFSSQLEASREAVDASNIRAKYAEMKAAYLADGNCDSVETKTVTAKQTDLTKWNRTFDFPAEIAEALGTPKSTWTFACGDDGAITVS